MYRQEHKNCLNSLLSWTLTSLWQDVNFVRDTLSSLIQETFNNNVNQTTVISYRSLLFDFSTTTQCFGTYTTTILIRDPSLSLWFTHHSQPLYIPPCCRGRQSYLLVVFACGYGSLKEDVGTLSGAADHGSVWVQCELMQVLLHFLMRKQLCNVFIRNHLYTHTKPC